MQKPARIQLKQINVIPFEGILEWPIEKANLRRGNGRAARTIFSPGSSAVVPLCGAPKTGTDK